MWHTKNLQSINKHLMRFTVYKDDGIFHTMPVTNCGSEYKPLLVYM